MKRWGKGGTNSLSKIDVAFAILGIGIGLLISVPIPTLQLDEATTDLMIWGIVLISGATGLILASKWKK